jgi:hypothetical protein
MIYVTLGVTNVTLTCKATAASGSKVASKFPAASASFAQNAIASVSGTQSALVGG